MLGNTLKLVILLGIYVIASCKLLAQTEWKFSLGTSYRDFDDVEFSSLAFRNSDNVNAVGGPFGIQDLAGMQPSLPNGAQVTAETVTFTGGSGDVDFSESWATVVVGAETTLDIVSLMNMEDRFSISLVFNFLLFEVEVNESHKGSAADPGEFVGTQSNYLVADGLVLVPPVASVNGIASGTSASVNNDFDMNLMVFDIGLKPTFSTDRLSAGVAIGYTMSIADIETRQREQGRFRDIANAVDASGVSVSGPYGISRNDETSDVLPGGYVAFEIEFGITDAIGLAFQYRYDWVGKSGVSNNQAELDLDGQSGAVRLVYNF